jgi:hypothetical protein
MMKPLTLSLSLAVAVGLSSTSLAGHHGKAMPSGQGPSPQVVPSAQEVGCGPVCGPVKRCHLFSGFKLPHISLPKLQHTTSYEWVLRKRHHWSFSHGHGAPVCDTCGTWPSGQGPSPQGVYAAPQGGMTYGAPQGAPAAGGSGQARTLAPVISDPAAEPPTLPRDASETPRQADAGGLLLLSPSGF